MDKDAIVGAQRGQGCHCGRTTWTRVPLWAHNVDKDAIVGAQRGQGCHCGRTTWARMPLWAHNVDKGAFGAIEGSQKFNLLSYTSCWISAILFPSICGSFFYDIVLVHYLTIVSVHV